MRNQLRSCFIFGSLTVVAVVCAEEPLKAYTGPRGGRPYPLMKREAKPRQPPPPPPTNAVPRATPATPAAPAATAAPAPAVPVPPAVAVLPAPPSTPSAYLELAPMIGHVSSTEARIWVRASGPAAMSVRIGEKVDLSDGRLVAGPALKSASAHMGHAVVSGLKPSTRYHYGVWLDGRPAMTQPYPSFTTAPPEGQPGRVRLAFTSCVGYHGYDSAPGFADMTRTNFDLLLMLGDNHYANTNDPGKQRRFYFDQRDTPGWRELGSRLPIYAIWDDHDYGPDNSDRRLKGKELSLQTFQEHWANPAYGEPDNPGVYFKFSRANVDFFLLDVRYHRDPNRATNLAHKTMLGPRQVNWLKRELLASRAPVKFLIAGGEWQSHGSDDSWTSFREERDDLLRFLEQERIEGVLLLSGDRHFTGAYQVQGKWIEVTAGPIGSANATAKNTPEMFLNFSGGKPKLYCIYDVDTTVSPPVVTLEVYKVAEGLALRRPFTWDEVIGRTKIPSLPPTAPVKTETKPQSKSETKPETKAESKAETKPAARPEAGPAAQPAAKPSAKPAPKPEKTPEA